MAVMRKPYLPDGALLWHSAATLSVPFCSLLQPTISQLTDAGCSPTAAFALGGGQRHTQLFIRLWHCLVLHRALANKRAQAHHNFWCLQHWFLHPALAKWHSPWLARLPNSGRFSQHQKAHLCSRAITCQISNPSSNTAFQYWRGTALWALLTAEKSWLI